jgi:hypothetical protein
MLPHKTTGLKLLDINVSKGRYIDNFMISHDLDTIRISVSNFVTLWDIMK